jgi:hypothetical protein
MRRPLLAGFLLLTLASTAATQSAAPTDDAASPMEILSTTSLQSQAAATPPAQPPTDPKADGIKKPDSAKPAERTVDPLTQCLRDWDTATHMSRQEWARTCRRVVRNRLKFLGEQQGK